MFFAGVWTKRRHARSHGLFSRVVHHIGRECHDGHLPPRSSQGTNLAGTAQAIHDGHVNVHQHQIEIGLTGLRERLLAVLGKTDLMAHALQQQAHHFAVDRMVFRHQNTQGLSGCDLMGWPLQGLLGQVRSTDLPKGFSSSG